jgi:uncharacterized membrane protein (DUF485 family)
MTDVQDNKGSPVAASLMMDASDQKKRIRRTAIIMGLIALAFYAGFILLGVLRS